MLLPPAAMGAFLKNRPPGPPEKLFIALRAVGSSSFGDWRDTREDNNDF